MIGAFILAAVVQAAPAGPAPPYEIRTFDQAYQDFSRICVATLPSRRRFAAAMGTNGVRWHRLQQTQQEIVATGISWQSTIGQISYHLVPDMQQVIGGPACHLEFLTDASYRHADAAIALERQLALPRGVNTGNRHESQMRWERRQPDGTHIRVFLTSGFPMAGGSGARLSISRTDTTPLPPEETHQ